MEIEIGRGKKARRAYGFDDVAIVPSRRTRDPDDVDITWTLGPYRFELPLLASAMDGVVSPETAQTVLTMMESAVDEGTGSSAVRDCSISASYSALEYRESFWSEFVVMMSRKLDASL